MDKQTLSYIDMLALKPNIKNDCIELFVKNNGHQQINEEAEYQNVDIQIEDQEEAQEHDDFYVEEEQQTTDQKGIKSKQFWSGMVQPNGATKPQQQHTNWDLKLSFSYGFNSLGRDTIILVQGKLCKAIGCMLIFGQHIYLKHNYTISTLSLNRKTNQVLSGSEGSSPQLVLWDYDKQQKQLIFNRKFCLGRRVQPITMISFFKNQYVFAIQKVCIHKSSNLYLYNKVTEKKYSIKVGKCYDLQLLQNQQKDDQVYISNQKGVFQLEFTNQQELQLKQLIQNQSITAFQPLQDQQKVFDIIYGNRQGEVCLNNANKKLKVHNGWIMEVKVCEFTKKQNKNYVITLGALDNKMVILTIQNKQITFFREFYMSGYVRSLFPQKDKILIGCRDGAIQQYNLISLLSLQNNKQKCIEYYSAGYDSFVSKQDVKYFFQYARHFKKYVYGKSDSKVINFISGIQSKKKQDYVLRQFPRTLAVFGSLIAYTYDIKNQINEKPAIIFMLSSKKNKKVVVQFFYKSILVIQDYVQNKLKVKVDLSFKNSQGKQNSFGQCSMLKWNQDGISLALGFTSGQLFIVNYEILKELNNNLEFSLEKQKVLHKQKISEIIWSKDSKYLKSTSESEVMYWQLQKTQKYEIYLKNVPNRVTKDVLWTQMGKFSWQNKQIWQKTSLIADITEIKAHQIIKTQKLSNKQTQSERQIIISCNYQNGKLGLFECPASSKAQKQFKLFSQKFKIIPNLLSKEELSFWVLYQGVITLLKVQTSKE